MRRLTMISAAAATTALVLAGCGTGSDTGDKTEANTPYKCSIKKVDTPKVGLAYDVGGRGDHSFNDSAYAGLAKSIKEFGVTHVEGEATDGEAESAREDRLRQMADGGANAIVGVGFAYATAIDAVSPDYPSTSFAVVDGFDPTDKSANCNVAYLGFAENESSFLVGIAAAEKTKTGTVGFVGGVHNDLIKKFEAGFVAGVKAAKPDVKVLVNYIQESDLKGFGDPAGGKAAATGQFDKGADIVYHAAGGSGSGVFDAAVDAGNGKWAIGVDSDQFLTATKAQQPHILTSALKRVDTATFDFVKSVDAGTPLTSYQTYDLKVDGVGYSKTGGFIDDISKDIDAYKAKIISGEIKVPTKP